MIQNIEHLRAELEIDALLDVRHLGHREIHVLESGTSDDIASRVAEAARMARERGLVEEQVGRGIGKSDGLARNQIGSVERLQTPAAVRQQRNDRAERSPGSNPASRMKGASVRITQIGSAPSLSGHPKRPRNGTVTMIQGPSRR